jgi:hypothetical protein
MLKQQTSIILAALLVAAGSVWPCVAAGANARSQPALVVCLDGPGWLVAPDAKNEGREAKWFGAPQPRAKRTKVPWIIQDAFPGYHGVAWYWREFVAPPNPHPGGRDLLRFWAVDYQAEVWLNGLPVGHHEGGESPFTLDVTGTLKPGAANLLAVRVLNPTHQAIDGMTLNETPHRNKALPYSAGSAWDQGGIVDSVDLLAVPALRVEDLQVVPDWKTGLLRIRANIRNAASGPLRGRLELAVGPASSGQAVASQRLEREFAAGDTLIDLQTRVAGHRLWELNDPFLYRVAARISGEDAASFDESSVRCGFRDFRLERGYFRLNGRRLFLRSSHTGNCSPVGLELPPDPDLLRRDLLNVKVMGFNCLRFISGVAKRYQLDLCDEIGLLVYEEAYASWCLADSPAMARRYDESILGMVRRDRNHPSLVMWGLLNETPEGAVFRHAVSVLPAVRAVDDTRVVMLNSGGWHESGLAALAGLQVWRLAAGPDPNVTHNPLPSPLVAPWATWSPGMLAMHPGPRNEFSVVRWTAPADDEVSVIAHFYGPVNQPTTDVHLLHKDRSVFDGWLNLQQQGNSVWQTNRLTLARGDTLDFVVGVGNGNYGGDTTGFEATIRGRDGKEFNAATGFVPAPQPGSLWSYGWLAPGAKPVAATFQPYPVSETDASKALGVISNPGSTNWEDVLSDQHPYQRTPHTAEILQKLRTMGGGPKPLFVSEYGVGSAVDLWRTTRHYERLGATHAEDARFYREKLDRFMVDWAGWRMAGVFGRPEDFFAASLRKMAAERSLGTSALRANPSVIGHSLTGTVDQGMTGEGLFTTWREFKPGTMDAMFDAWAPLRWCLLAEPVNVYRGSTVRCEVVLANEDQLAPGDYPARAQIFGPHNELVWEKPFTASIASPDGPHEPPFALPMLSESVVIDGPPGRYRLVATFDRGAAPAGTEAVFHVADRVKAQAPGEVTLWGRDSVLAEWCTKQGLRTRPFSAGQTGREVVLAAARPPEPVPESFRELARHVARGSTVVCLAPEVFARDKDSGGWLPLARKGTRKDIGSWLYHKDEWARPHAVFEGLPTGMMDYVFYRDLIPDAVWVLPETPSLVLSGANNASQDYSSGVLLASIDLGAGRFVINALRLRETLGVHPAADRLLLNLLRWASEEPAKPLADLPADFDQRLETLGYKPGAK